MEKDILESLYNEEEINEALNRRGYNSDGDPMVFVDTINDSEGIVSIE